MIMYPGLKKLIFGLGLALLSVSIGIIGFMTIEDYNFTQATYMTAITISTVGFREAKPLSEGGMIFTSAYIMFNLGLVAYVVSYSARFIFDGELRNQYQHYTNSKELRKMKDHVIVCGYGRNGSKAVKELKESKIKCVVIDNRTELADELLKIVDASIIGNASDEENLIEAGITKAKTLIIALPNDAENVFITLSARELNPEIQIISRAANELTQKKLLKAGANTVIMPDSLGGKHMAQLVTKPSVIQFLNLLESVGSKFAIEQVSYDDLKIDHHGESIREMNIRNMTGVSVVAYQTTGGSFQINPPAQTVLDPGSNYIILGRRDELDHFKDTFLIKNRFSHTKN